MLMFLKLVKDRFSQKVMRILFGVIHQTNYVKVVRNIIFYFSLVYWFCEFI